MGLNTTYFWLNLTISYTVQPFPVRKCPFIVVCLYTCHSTWKSEKKYSPFYLDKVHFLGLFLPCFPCLSIDMKFLSALVWQTYCNWLCYHHKEESTFFIVDEEKSFYTPSFSVPFGHVFGRRRFLLALFIKLRDLLWRTGTTAGWWPPHPRYAVHYIIWKSVIVICMFTSKRSDCPAKFLCLCCAVFH